MSYYTDADVILADVQSQWSLASPLSQGDIHFHVDWYDPKQIKPQITLFGPTYTPIKYFGPPSPPGTLSLNLISWQRFALNTWVIIPRGEDSGLHAEYSDKMRKECIRILNLRRATYCSNNLGLVFPLDEGRPLHEMDVTPRILRWEITVQANRKHT